VESTIELDELWVMGRMEDDLGDGTVTSLEIEVAIRG
jgi:hypothetical protein